VDETNPSLLNAARPLGLALGGGAALGWAHIGALRVLDEAGIKPDIVAGSSIGALVGAAWICGALDPLEEIARSMSWRRLMRYADPRLGVPGLIRGEAIVQELVRHLGSHRVEALRPRFAAVAADLIAGEEIEITEGPLELAIRASISVPGVFSPVEQGGRLLVDGGLVNPVPVTAARALGAARVIAIDVMGDYHGRARAAGVHDKGAGPQPNGERSALLRWFPETWLPRGPKRPGLTAIATVSAALIMRKLAEANFRLAPADLHVVPAIGHISPIEFDRADELIAAGRTAMAAQLPALDKIRSQCGENAYE
jgi:NTE family protein